MTTETIKACNGSVRKLALERIVEIDATKGLDTIIHIDHVILELELHLSRRATPFTEEEFALIERLEKILKRAKLVYMEQP